MDGGNNIELTTKQITGKNKIDKVFKKKPVVKELNQSEINKMFGIKEK